MQHTSGPPSKSGAASTVPAVGSVGLAHDYLLVLRGAERSFAAIADCFPAAPIYTLLYDEEGTSARFAGHEVTTSYLQRLGVRQDGFRRLLPLFPGAVQRLPTDRHLLVISSSSAFAHGVSPAEGGAHLCYCYTPFRYAWFEEKRALSEVPAPLRLPLRAALARSRAWDRAVSRRVTRYVAISELSRERIARYLQRESDIVHPPVETHRFSPGEPEDEFLIVCELVRHKRVDIALEAARRAGVRVKVVGSGPDRQRLESLYGDVAAFLGRVGDDELVELHRRALALILPNVEEFGIAAVEAQAAGRPVLAADAGGAQETVLDGETGVRVPVDSVDALTEALRETDWRSFDPERCVVQADRFSVATFQRLMLDQVALAQAAALNDVPNR